MRSLTLRLTLTSIVAAGLACSGGTADQDAGDGADAGPASTDGGPSNTDAGPTFDAGPGADAGQPLVDAGPPADAGSPVDAGSPADALAGLVAIYEAKGSVDSVIGAQAVTLMVPVVAFQKKSQAHVYDDRMGGEFGCTADHYTPASPAPADSSAGTVVISGYTGGSLLLGGSAASTITCSGANYACDYTGGKAAATQPYKSSADPLGNGPITFTGSGGAAFGSFTIQASPFGTLTVSQDLSKIKYSTTADTTLTYSCGGSCSGSLVLVSLLASENSTSNPSGASNNTGSVSCVQSATGSITIPAGAIAGMFDNDSSLQSVVTTVLRVSATIPSTVDASGQSVSANVGKGVFGIASK
jgi:hypothetical protein